MTQKTKKAAGGRPTKYLPEYCEQIIEHMSGGASMTSFAADIGVCRSTLNIWIRDIPEFKEAVEIGKVKSVSWWEETMRATATTGRGSAHLIIFALKNLGADDWRDRQEIDHTSKGEAVRSFNQMYSKTDGNT